MISSIRCGIALLLWSGIAAGDPRWIRIESPNFEIYSSAGERGTRDTLRHFEQVRTFFVQALLGGVSKPFPVRIVAFGSKKDYEPYRFNEFASAYYHPGTERDYIVMSETGIETFPIAVHEYMHLVMRHADLNFAPWMNEGFAELYSTLKPMGDQVLIGSLIPGRVRALREDKWIPLSVILAADRDSPYYNEKARAGSLYNEGWALIHMLSLSKEYRPGFEQFYNLMRAGTPSVQALEKAYSKPLAAIEKDLQQYLRGDRFTGAVFPVKLTKVTAELPATTPQAYDVKLVLTDLTNRRGREAQTRKALEELVQEDPKRSEAHAALGYLAWRGRSREEAREHFARAFDLGSRGPRMLLDYGNLAFDDPPQATRAYNALLEQQPDHVEARLRLASVQLNARQANQALATLAPVKKVTSDEAPRLFRIMAYAQLQSGFRKEALETAERFASVAKSDTDRDDANRLIAMLKAPPSREVQSSRPIVPQRVDAPEGEVPKLRRQDQTDQPVKVQQSRLSALPSVEGSFVNFDCSGPKPRVVVQAKEGKKTFVIEEPNNIVVESKKVGQVELTCGPQTPQRIRVIYLPAENAASPIAGIVKALYFEP